MSQTLTASATDPGELNTEPQNTTTVLLRPRYEGSNICTWIGFKHVNYLVEEAVLDHLRQHGLAAGELYERYGVCVDIVDIDTRMWTAFHIDDVAKATVRPLDGEGPELWFQVEMVAERDEPVRTVTAKVGVSLRLDHRGFSAEELPAELTEYVVPKLSSNAGLREEAGDDPITQLTAGQNAYGWSWRVPYPYCHFTERLQMSGYLRLMEEAVDRFLADRGVSIKRLLDEQNWIPVVPSSSITMLEEVGMEETLHITFTVEKVFKRLTYIARMDCHVVRDGRLVHTATGRITHGYAVIENRRDWRQVDFDDRLAGALSGKAAS
jgi:acyl-CoA thioesterase FadM